MFDLEKPPDISVGGLFCARISDARTLEILKRKSNFLAGVNRINFLFQSITQKYWQGQTVSRFAGPTVSKNIFWL